jgi:hypothetical protein
MQSSAAHAQAEAAHHPQRPQGTNCGCKCSLHPSHTAPLAWSRPLASETLWPPHLLVSQAPLTAWLSAALPYSPSSPTWAQSLLGSCPVMPGSQVPVLASVVVVFSSWRRGLPGVILTLVRALPLWKGCVPCCFSGLLLFNSICRWCGCLPWSS